MKTEHTPGPWTNNKWNSEEHQISAKGGTIALVSHTHTLVAEAEADANARLVAASPCLLKALQDLIAADNCNYTVETIRYTGLFNAARAAVTKATGG